MKYEAPLEPKLVDELFDFWLPIFEGQLDVTPDVLLGHELPHSRIIVHTRRLNGKLAGACLVATSEATPSLGGFGEVATSSDARRSGIATALSQQALDDFREQGGQALFLGTSNPDAARIYFRLGWRKLAGANLMVNISNCDSPEEFLVDYFRGLGSATVRTPTPADRAPMIPLLVSPHDWQVLDFNTSMLSTRYAVQGSCLGLYRRYLAIADDEQGAWFCASTAHGEIVGLSTVRLEDDGSCRVDGFAHRNHLGSWQALLQTAVDWSVGRSASQIYATVSTEDDEKRTLFESLNFKNGGAGEPFDLGGRQVATLRLELQ